MTDIDSRLTMLLAVPERPTDVAFANDVARRVEAGRVLAARLAAERRRTATLLVASISVAAGLWTFAQGKAFVAVTGGGAAGLAALAAVMALWIGVQSAGAFAAD